MKMNKYFAMALALGVSALLAGCNDAAVEEESAVPAATTGTVSATIEKDADGTRTDLLQIDETYYRNYWEASDQVSIFPYGNANRVGKLTSGAGSDVAVFKWDKIPGDKIITETHYGVYPYNPNDHVDNTTQMIHTELPVVQTYNEGSFGGQNAYMTAYSEVSDGGYTLNYQYYHGALGIQLYGDAVVDKIRVTVTGVRNIAGEVHIPTPYLPNPGYPQAKTPTTAEAARTVTFNCGTHGDLTGTTASSPKLFSIALLPGTINNLKVEVLDAAGNVLLTKTATNKNIEIKRNVIKTMAPFEVYEYAIDLGSAANCYMIHKPGTYKFPTISRTGDEDVNPNQTIYVDWVWRTDGVNPNKIRFKKNQKYIYFTIDEFTSGSFVIGLCAGEGINANVYNNWHIWMTEKPELYTLSNGTVMMDRNLGSMTVDVNTAAGFLYQFSRQTPLINCVDDDPIVNETWANRIGSLSHWDSSINEYMVTEDAMIHLSPTEFIVYSSPEYINGTYQNVPKWSSFDESTCQKLRDNLWLKSRKYDPCPAGYRIPTWAMVSNATMTHDYYSGNYGFQTNNGTLYIPKQPYFDCYEAIIEDDPCFWVANQHRTNEYRYGFSAVFEYSQYEYEYVLSAIGQLYANALPVRCVKE